MKHKSEKRFVSSVSTYVLSNILVSAIPFILLPILTRYLSTEDYGILSIFTVFLSILSAFVGLNTHGALARNYYDLNKQEIKIYLLSVMIIVVSSAFVIFILAIVFQNIIRIYTPLTFRLVLVAIFISFASFIIRLHLTLLQVQKKSFSFGMYSLAKAITAALLVIFFVVILGYTWQGKIFAQLYTALSFLLITILVLFRQQWLTRKVSLKYIKDALKFGIPLMPHAIGGILITSMDRFFINNFIGLEETGIYSVGYQIGSIINIIANAINLAYVPILYEMLKKNNYSEKIRTVKLTYMYFGVLLVMTASLTLISNIGLRYFLGDQFTSSSIYVGWIALGYVFNAMYFMMSAYIFYMKKTKYMGAVTITMVLFNAVFNTILIPRFGALGAAYATILVFILKFLIVWHLAHKFSPMPWNLLKRRQYE